jgi:transcriptional regulator with XRE-family HTH domain
MSGIIHKLLNQFLLISFNFAQNINVVMNQPQLGKKIAELRKAKGLTQEELVIVCKLNVRTLQRIESGEVTPRSYTIKIIFTALESSFYEGVNNTTKEISDPDIISFFRPGQIYKYVLKLINLKTNTMKKLLILTAIIIGLVFLFSDFSKAQSSSFDKSKLVGTWKLCDSSGNVDLTGNGRYKIITSNTFAVVEADQKNSFFSGEFIGTYTLENDTYVETINLTNPAMHQYKGLKNSFKIEFKGDLMYSKGIGNPYNEIWKRVDNLTLGTK